MSTPDNALVPENGRGVDSDALIRRGKFVATTTCNKKKTIKKPVQPPKYN